MVIVINTVIGGFSWTDSVWLTASTAGLHVSDYSQLSDYNYTEWLMKNKAANAPITLEEIVMVMINTNTGLYVHTDKTKCVLDISQAKHQYRFNY